MRKASWKKHHIQLLSIDSMDQLNPGFFKNCEKTYHPAQVIVEWNGTWDVQTILAWSIQKDGWCRRLRHCRCHHHGCLHDQYAEMFLEPLFQAELILLNRCTEQTNRGLFRRTIKASNPQVQFIFEDTEGNIIQQGEDDLPFDRKADFIDLDDMDYGIWYLDASDHPEVYDGKRRVSGHRCIPVCVLKEACLYQSVSL